MPSTLLPLTPRTEHQDVEYIDDLDLIVESSKCACNAGDDNPY